MDSMYLPSYAALNLIEQIATYKIAIADLHF